MKPGMQSARTVSRPVDVRRRRYSSEIEQPRIVVRRAVSVALFALLFVAGQIPDARAEIAVEDDLGRRIVLDEPARRIVSLAPHVTEILFAAGAGAFVVGATLWSDHPDAASRITRIGDTHNIDLETIAALRPDLVVGWQSGNGPARIRRLEELGYRVFVSEPASLEAIGDSLRRLGRLAGTDGIAGAEKTRFDARLAALRRTYSGRSAVSVFYQVWNQPMFTVNGDHLISRIIELCGGRNVFADLPSLSPQIGIEAVLAADPEVIVASGADANRPQWLEEWSSWPTLQAVRGRRVHHIPPDLIQRHTVRILDGAELMCAFIEQARIETVIMRAK
jgi:iron complex transport system substrate-binding protein